MCVDRSLRAQAKAEQSSIQRNDQSESPVVVGLIARLGSPSEGRQKHFDAAGDEQRRRDQSQKPPGGRVDCAERLGNEKIADLVG